MFDIGASRKHTNKNNDDDGRSSFSSWFVYIRYHYKTSRVMDWCGRVTPRIERDETAATRAVNNNEEKAIESHARRNKQDKVRKEEMMMMIKKDRKRGI